MTFSNLQNSLTLKKKSDLDVSGTHNFAKKIHWKRFRSIKGVNCVQHAVFMQHRIQKPYKAKCAKTVIAYEIKTEHQKDFLKALLICNSSTLVKCCVAIFSLLRPFIDLQLYSLL